MIKIQYKMTPIWGMFTLLFLLLSNIALAQEEVIFKGKISNPNSDSLVLSGRTMNKIIKIDSEGSFTTSFQLLEPGFYRVYDGKESASLYLNHGYDLYLTLNTTEFDESISLKGEGAQLSNFFFEKYMEEELLVYPRIAEMDSSHFVAMMDSLRFAYTKGINDLALPKVETNAGLDRIQNNLRQINSRYYWIQKIKLLDRFIGQPLQNFEFKTANGQKISTDDLKGKPIYIDVWATWCRPCVMEIPALKELESIYGEQIQFLSISIDVKKNEEKWLEMVNNLELKGIQVISRGGWKTEFAQAYDVNAIPRFLLIDKEGKIVSANAPRPSDTENIKMALDALLVDQD